MAAKKKAKTTKKKKASKAKKAKAAPSKKSKKTVKKPAKKAAPKKAKKRVKAAAKKAPAKKAVNKRAAKKTIGEGDYAASRAFLRTRLALSKRTKPRSRPWARRPKRPWMGPKAPASGMRKLPPPPARATSSDLDPKSRRRRSFERRRFSFRGPTLLRA